MACTYPSADERFEAGYIPEPNSGCFIWLGNRVGNNGYGSLRVEGKNMRAHRYSWERDEGPIPEGLSVLHRCDTPLCVRKEHLFLGYQCDNVKDRDRKKRTAVGEKNGKFIHGLSQTLEYKAEKAREKYWRDKL